MHGAQLAPDVELRGHGGRKQLMALVEREGLEPSIPAL